MGYADIHVPPVALVPQKATPAGAFDKVVVASYLSSAEKSGSPMPLLTATSAGELETFKTPPVTLVEPESVLNVWPVFAIAAANVVMTLF